MEQTKQGTLEAISMEKNVVKITEEKYWLLVKSDEVKKEAMRIKKGSKIEYTCYFDIKDKKLVLKAIKPLSQSSPPQTPKEPPKDDYRALMEYTIKEVNSMIPLIENVEIRNNMNWASVIDTLYLSKIKK